MMAEYRWGDILPSEQDAGFPSYRWGDRLPMEQFAQPQPQAQPQMQPMGLGGPQASQPQQEEQPNFLQRMLNPTTLAGLAGFESAFRGGNAFPAMEHGWKIGQAQEDARKKAVQEAAIKAML